MKNRLIYFLLCSALSLVSCGSSAQDQPEGPSQPEQPSVRYFQNPIKYDGADPWMVKHNGTYYLSESDGNTKIYVLESSTITQMGYAKSTLVYDFVKQATGKNSVWGPHLNYVKGKWYIYYCGQAKTDDQFTSQRMWAMRSTTDSPYGPYEEMGEVLDSNDTEWAIDGSVLQRANGDLYFVWSGIKDLSSLHQHSFIAKMTSPTRIDRSTIVNISSPVEVWETSVRPIQEGQRPLVVDKEGKTIVMFSANASWTDEYCLGSLTNTDGNFLNPESWVKSKTPVFQKTNSIFGPGGASYVKSPDGTEDWIVYHSAKKQGAGWDRSIRTQKFTWDTHGNPVFGEPVGDGVKLPVPSGE